MKRIIFSFAIIFFTQNLFAQNFISDKNEKGAFPIVANFSTTIYTDKNDDWLIQKAASLFATDVDMVTGKKPEISNSIPSNANNVIIIGSIKGSKLIQQLIQTKKINVDSIKNKWEAYQIQIIKNPFKGIEQALVITGSDKRGTAYGVFENFQRDGYLTVVLLVRRPSKEKERSVYKKWNVPNSDGLL